MTKKQRLLELFGRAEANRHRILTNLQKVNAKRLTTPATTDSWTVAQVVTHLALAEEGALAYLDKKLEVKEHGPAPWSSPFRLWFLNVAIRLPIKYKAPAIIALVPRTSFEVAVERWRSIRERTSARYSELDEAILGHDLFKHPLLGKFNLFQGLGYMNEHVLHHEAQIGRILHAVP